MISHRLEAVFFTKKIQLPSQTDKCRLNRKLNLPYVQFGRVKCQLKSCFFSSKNSTADLVKPLSRLEAVEFAIYTVTMKNNIS